MKILKGANGFSIVELAVVIAIIAVLLGIALPMWNLNTLEKEKQATQGDLENLKQAMLAFYEDTGYFPPLPDQLQKVTGSRYVPYDYLPTDISLEETTGWEALYTRCLQYLERKECICEDFNNAPALDCSGDWLIDVPGFNIEEFNPIEVYERWNGPYISGPYAIDPGGPDQDFNTPVDNAMDIRRNDYKYDAWGKVYIYEREFGLNLTSNECDFYGEGKPDDSWSYDSSKGYTQKRTLTTWWVDQIYSMGPTGNLISFCNRMNDNLEDQIADDFVIHIDSADTDLVKTAQTQKTVEKVREALIKFYNDMGSFPPDFCTRTDLALDCSGDHTPTGCFTFDVDKNSLLFLESNQRHDQGGLLPTWASYFTPGDACVDEWLEHLSKDWKGPYITAENYYFGKRTDNGGGGDPADPYDDCYPDYALDAWGNPLVFELYDFDGSIANICFGVVRQATTCAITSVGPDKIYDCGENDDLPSQTKVTDGSPRLDYDNVSGKPIVRDKSLEAQEEINTIKEALMRFYEDCGDFPPYPGSWTQLLIDIADPDTNIAKTRARDALYYLIGGEAFRNMIAGSSSTIPDDWKAIGQQKLTNWNGPYLVTGESSGSFDYDRFPNGYNPDILMDPWGFPYVYFYPMFDPAVPPADPTQKQLQRSCGLYSRGQNGISLMFTYDIGGGGWDAIPFEAKDDVPLCFIWITGSIENDRPCPIDPQVIDREKEKATRAEMDQLMYAIVGDPSIVSSNGIRTEFGFLGDRSMMPDGTRDPNHTLIDLIVDPALPPPIRPWKGPYAERGKITSSNSADPTQVRYDYETDAWGNPYMYYFWDPRSGTPATFPCTPLDFNDDTQNSNICKDPNGNFDPNRYIAVIQSGGSDYKPWETGSPGLGNLCDETDPFRQDDVIRAVCLDYGYTYFDPNFPNPFQMFSGEANSSGNAFGTICLTITYQKEDNTPETWQTDTAEQEMLIFESVSLSEMCANGLPLPGQNFLNFYCSTDPTADPTLGYIPNGVWSLYGNMTVGYSTWNGTITLGGKTKMSDGMYIKPPEFLIDFVAP